MQNNDSFTAIDNIIELYSKGLLTIEESTEKLIDTVNQFTWFITDPDIKSKAHSILYKRYFIRMNKAINKMNRQV